MAAVASLVANPILLRNPDPKFRAAKLSASRHALSSSFSASSSPKFNVVVKLKSCFASRHASLCKPPSAVIKDDLCIRKPLGRVGGKWSTKYPYDPLSKNPSDCPWLFASYIILFYPIMACMVWRTYRPIWFNALVLIILAVLLVWFVWNCERATVVKIQVGFSGKGRELGFDLNQIAESADTSTYKGLTYVLNETIVTLLRHLEYYESSSIYVVSVFGRQAANHYIDDFSFEKRLSNKETLVNVNNVKWQSPTSRQTVDDQYNDDLKVTLFVGFRYKLELSTVNNKYDLENVLHKLRSVASSNVLTAVETLWTPQVSSRAASST